MELVRRALAGRYRDVRRGCSAEGVGGPVRLEKRMSTQVLPSGFGCSGGYGARGVTSYSLNVARLGVVDEVGGLSVWRGERVPVSRNASGSVDSGCFYR